jgi:hypothetical protein
MALLLGALWCAAAAGQTVQDVLDARANTTREGRAAQQTVDALTEDTRDLLADYRRTLRALDDLRAYNRQQRRLLESREADLADIAASIDEAAGVERQVRPLMERMIAALERFVELDVPFLLRERRERLAGLRELAGRGDVTLAEQLGQVLQAYQIEDQYGASVEAYSDVVRVNGRDWQADLLKWGRVALLFQTPDGSLTGFWNPRTRAWELLDGGWAAEVRNGLRMARRNLTPDLVRLPVPSPEAAPAGAGP